MDYLTFKRDRRYACGMNRFSKRRDSNRLGARLAAAGGSHSCTSRLCAMEASAPAVRATDSTSMVCGPMKE